MAMMAAASLSSRPLPVHPSFQPLLLEEGWEKCPAARCVAGSGNSFCSGSVGGFVCALGRVRVLVLVSPCPSVKPTHPHPITSFQAAPGGSQHDDGPASPA